MAQSFIGTSGFDYREWKPTFYPADLPRKHFLQYYATHFRSVELNNTFYRIPNAERIASWSAATPEDFRFALKAPRKITHNERLKSPSESLGYFLQTASGLKQRLGALLFQLPPFFKCDHERLSEFLGILPSEVPVALEFRHESWFTEDIYRALEKKSVALCINDGDDKTTPILVTSRFAYLRLRRSHYTPEQVRQWRGRMRSWVDQGIDVYAFVKHEGNPDAPRIALEFGGESKP
jgi:uncharacterized protein YecE (DUF72 family)